LIKHCNRKGAGQFPREDSLQFDMTVRPLGLGERDIGLAGSADENRRLEHGS
jgi:hypothetical protein